MRENIVLYLTDDFVFAKASNATLAKALVSCFTKHTGEPVQVIEWTQEKPGLFVGKRI